MKLKELLEVMNDSEQVVITSSEDDELSNFKGSVRHFKQDSRIMDHDVVVFYLSKADSLNHILITSK